MHKYHLCGFIKRIFIILSILCLTPIVSLNLAACKSPGNRPNYEDALPPDNLKINLMSAPLGVELDDIRFSWQMNDSDSGEIQTAYRIVISETKSDFEKKRYIYDSDWIESSEDACVKFCEPKKYLRANRLYYWAVATKDKDGNISAFSHPQAFTTEMSDEWTSTCGIWASNSNGAAEDSFVFLRNKFKAENFGKIEKVVLSVTATGTEPSRQFVYNVYVNGNRIGVGPCREGINQDGNSVLYYNSYDITEFILPEYNSVAAINYAEEGKAFLCQITAFYKDGASGVWVNSGRDYLNWKSLPADDVFGKSNSVGTGYYTASANNVDSTVYPFGFSGSEFNDDDWPECYRCESIDSDIILKSGQYSPVTRYERSGASVNRLHNGDYLVDLKQEIVGGIKIRFNGVRGEKVKLYYGEQLNGDGTVKWHMNTDNKYIETFTLKDGEQIIETIDMLTYRYVQVSGYTQSLKPSDVCGLEIRAPFNEDDATFYSDSPLLNEIFNLTKSTIKYTTQDIMVDSQSRERRCYEGDLLINALASYAVSSNLSPVALSLEYSLTHKTFEDYLLHSVIAVKQNYLYTGDDTIIKKYYNILKEKCNFSQIDAKHGLVANKEMIVMDWPENDRDNYDMEAEYNTAYNCIKYKAYSDMADIAVIAGDEATRKKCLENASVIKKSLIDKTYNETVGAYCDGLYADGRLSAHYSQHATAYALWAGVYENGMMPDMVDYITSDNKMKTSVFGAFFLLDGLYRSGNGNIANALLTDDDTSEGAKTWAYMLKTLGATLTTEAWNEEIKDNMTLSHPWSASPAYFIQSGICGIEPVSAGFEKFRIKPAVSGLNNFEYETRTVKGIIKVGYTKTDSRTCLNLEIPANTTAQIDIDCEESNQVYIGGKKVLSDYCGGYRRFEVGSGKVSIEIR